jgi:hypothetical protein
MMASRKSFLDRQSYDRPGEDRNEKSAGNEIAIVR